MRTIASLCSTTSGKWLGVAIALLLLPLIGQFLLEPDPYDTPSFRNATSAAGFMAGSLIIFFGLSRRFHFFPAHQPFLQNFTAVLLSVVLTAMCLILTMMSLVIFPSLVAQ